MRARTKYLLAVAGAVVAIAAIGVPYALGAARQAKEPGDPVTGKRVFVAFCGKCHTMRAAGSKGTLGPNLDQDRVSYTQVIMAIEEGVGGIQAEYVLRHVTFDEVADVAKFVVTSRVGPGIRPSSPDN